MEGHNPVRAVNSIGELPMHRRPSPAKGGLSAMGIDAERQNNQNRRRSDVTHLSIAGPVLTTYCSCLAIENYMIAPVLLPAIHVVIGAERLLLTKTDDPDSAALDAGKRQRILHRLGTALAERDVVLL